VASCLRPGLALSLFTQNPQAVDLVVTDFAMPGMTGIDLAEKIRSVRPEVPVILCTGYGEHLSGEAMESAGIKSFLIKPIRRRTLGKAVAGVLKPGLEISPGPAGG
jgi:YesN/AraC family two-component response regulator